LDEVYEKKVSDEIKQHNKEKKLIYEMANQEAPRFLRILRPLLTMNEKMDRG
jgi:hypothetical protein